MLPLWLSEHLPTAFTFMLMAGVTATGCVVRGFSGFGAGLLMAPVFSLVMAPTDVVVVILFLNLLTTIQLLPGSLRSVDWGLVARLFVPTILGMPIGLMLLHFVEPIVMRKTVAIIVILAATVLLIGWVYRGPSGRLQDVIVGASSGFLTAIGGVGGPPVILYLLSMPHMSPSVVRAVCVVFFSLTQISTLIPLGLTGSMTSKQAVTVVLLLPISVIASMVGTYLHVWSVGRHQASVRQASLVLLLVIGVAALLL